MHRWARVFASCNKEKSIAGSKSIQKAVGEIKMAKKKHGYKIISPLFFGNVIVESKAMGKSIAKDFKVKPKELKFKKYSW